MEGFHYLFHPVTRRAFDLAADGTLGEIHHVEVRMAMPPPDAHDPRWSFELAGGALMDLGCYGLHVMRRLGAIIGGPPHILSAHASQHTPGVDEWCDIELSFPSDATGLSANTMSPMIIRSPCASSGPTEMCWCTTSSSPMSTTG